MNCGRRKLWGGEKGEGGGEGSAEERTRPHSPTRSRSRLARPVPNRAREFGTKRQRRAKGAIYGASVRAGKGQKSWLCLGVSRNTTRGAGSAHKTIPYCLRPPHPKAASQVSLRPCTNLHDVQFSFSLLPTVLSFLPAPLSFARSISPRCSLIFKVGILRLPDQTHPQTRSDLHTLYSHFCSLKVCPAFLPLDASR